MDSTQIWNLTLLLVLYFLQGIPLGISAAVPMMLASRNISYSQQAMFSLVYWPFSIKLLWAPVVDVLYVSSVGRRKSWLIPVQLLLGVVLLLLGSSIDVGEVSVSSLTCCFFLVNFLAATQDIAVDGWALSLLSRELVGYASTCNSVGQTAGYFIGFMVLLALESEDFTNAYLRASPGEGGLVTLGGYMGFWGVVFIVVTLTVCLLKREDRDRTSRMTLSEAYSELWKILKKEVVLEYCLIVFTSKIAFAATDSISHLKLINAGVPKQNLALLAIPIAPIQIVLPWLFSRYTVGPHPMDLFVRAYPYRLMFNVVNAMLVYVTLQAGAEFSSSYYIVLLSVSLLHQLTVVPMFVAAMAYHNVVSDPVIGGTYMTLLNTVMNISGNWPATLSLWLVDYVGVRRCEGEECETLLDGYYLLTGLGLLVGVVWVRVMGSKLGILQRKSRDLWKCSIAS